MSATSTSLETRLKAQAFGLGFQLGKSDTEFVNHLIKGGTSDIGKVLFAQMFPEMFRRIEFRAVGWLWDQADVLRHLEIFGMMPSRLIHLHHDKRVLEGLGDMLQKEIPGSFNRRKARARIVLQEKPGRSGNAYPGRQQCARSLISALRRSRCNRRKPKR